jgi:hypothetical protein
MNVKKRRVFDIQYIHTYIHILIHAYVLTYQHTCMQTSTYVRIYIYIHTHIHRYIHTHIHTYTHTYTHTHVRTYIRSTIHYITYNLIPMLLMINFMLFISNILKEFWHFYFPCLHNFQVQNFPGTLQHSRLVSISTYSNSVIHRLRRIPKHRQVDHASNVSHCRKHPISISSGIRLLLLYSTTFSHIFRTNSIVMFYKYCNRLPYLPDFGYNNYVARRKHGSLSRNIQGELKDALFFQ